MTSSSYRLYARPSFVEGIGRLWDWAGSYNMYNFAPDEVTADRWALGSDWRQVGQDLRAAVASYKLPAH